VPGRPTDAGDRGYGNFLEPCKGEVPRMGGFYEIRMAPVLR
jgi:hypothetical protein